MSCLACEAQAPGGRILETPGWIVEHTVGSLGVGTLVVKTRRHVLYLGDLTDDEAAELGPLPHGPRLQVALFDRARAPDPEAAAAFASRARELLAQNP